MKLHIWPKLDSPEKMRKSLYRWSSKSVAWFSPPIESQETSKRSMRFYLWPQKEDMGTWHEQLRLEEGFNKNPQTAGFCVEFLRKKLRFMSFGQVEEPLRREQAMLHLAFQTYKQMDQIHQSHQQKIRG